MVPYLLKFIGIVIVTSLISACFAPNVVELRNPLQDQYTEVSRLDDKNLTFNSTHVAVGIKPHETLNFVPPTQNQAGLIGVFVQAVMNSSTNADIQDGQRTIQPVRNAVLRYNFGSKARSAVQDSLTSIDWLNVSYVGKYPALQQRNVEKLLQDNADDAVFIIDSSYSFSNDFNSITVHCYAALHSKNKLLMSGEDHRPDDMLIYRKKFSYTHNLDRAYQDKHQAIKKWSENDGIMVTQALDNALKDIATRLAIDVQQKRS